MWRIYELVTSNIIVADQTYLLIYMRKFDCGFVLYEECIAMQYDQRVIIESDGVRTHSIEKVDLMCELTPEQRQQLDNLQ